MGRADLVVTRAADEVDIDRVAVPNCYSIGAGRSIPTTQQLQES
jgi:hypothetical protein